MCRILYNLYLPFVGLYESFSINDCYDSLIAILLLFTGLSGMLLFTVYCLRFGVILSYHISLLMPLLNLCVWLLPARTCGPWDGSLIRFGDQGTVLKDRGDRSASCAPDAVNHSFNIVDFCHDSLGKSLAKPFTKIQ